ncbi:MAG: NAD(P)H-hydrate dehydratase [Rhodanobacteraceae bacterium]
MSSPTLNLYTPAQVRKLDRLAIDEHGVSGYTLMQRAARAALQDLHRLWPRATRLTIVCGPGNNGGDGFLLGALALQQGLQVQIVALSEQSSGDAAQAREDFLSAGGEIRQAQAGRPLPPADVHVDALFGSGFDRAAEGLAAELIDRLNGVNAPVLAIDVPSGLQADTGRMLGECVRADATICLVAWKQGLFTGQGADCCGQLSLARLGLPDALYDKVAASARLLQVECLPPRQHDSHKGRYGHVLVIGGDSGFGGAVRLAGEAALRCGAGLVSVATRGSHVAPLLAARPELMVHAIGDDGVNSALLERAGVLVAGPGLGQDDWGRCLFAQAMAAEQPMVLDADGLNLLACHNQEFAGRAVVLTPHPGEAARLLGSDTAAVQADRFAAARELACRYRCVVVLKGAGSLIANADGEVGVCPWGNPGMASGGMGDVLSGVIGALMAQGLDAWRAACLGTGLHSRAGDRAALQGQRGMLASDLLPALRSLLVPGHD